MCGVLLTNRNPVTNETILDGWAESTSHDTECVTGTPCPTSVKNISFVTEWLRLGKSYREVSTYRDLTNRLNFTHVRQTDTLTLRMLPTSSSASVR